MILSMVAFMRKFQTLLLSFFLSILFISMLSAGDVTTLPQYSYITPLKTQQPDGSGKPLVTTVSVLCEIDMQSAQETLLIDSYYNNWVIQGLNALNTELHNPMTVYDRIETSDTGDELYLYFDLQNPFKVADIMIPFIFTVVSNNENGTRVELRLKKRNIVVRNAALDLLVQQGASGTILSAELTIDFSFIINVLLNKPLYAENTEKRLRLCLEQLLVLLSEKNLISSQ